MAFSFCYFIFLMPDVPWMQKNMESIVQSLSLHTHFPASPGNKTDDLLVIIVGSNVPLLIDKGRASYLKISPAERFGWASLGVMKRLKLIT